MLRRELKSFFAADSATLLWNRSVVVVVVVAVVMGVNVFCGKNAVVVFGEVPRTGLSHRDDEILAAATRADERDLADESSSIFGNKKVKFFTGVWCGQNG